MSIRLPILVLGLTLTFSLPFVPARATGGSGIVWMVSAKAISLIESEPNGTALVEAFFDNPNTYVMAPRDQLEMVPPKAIATINFASFAAMRSAFGAHNVDPRYGAVLYDCEGWAYTPLEEQKNPIYYHTLAAELAHNFRLKFIAAPATTLRRALLRPSPDGTYPPFLTTGIVGPIAKVADIFEIQAQGMITQPKAYAALVTNAATEATGANPNITFLAGLSTGPSGQRVTAQQLYQAVAATRAVVAGYWLNIPEQSGYCENCAGARPDVAIGLLQLLKKQSP